MPATKATTVNRRNVVNDEISMQEMGVGRRRLMESELTTIPYTYTVELPYDT
jgi:hypothetical protein